MNAPINYHFEPQLNAYCITMPDNISLQAIKNFRTAFANSLQPSPGQVIRLLVDVKQHAFDSVASMKALREFFTDTTVFQDAALSVAFVTPARYMPPHIKSDSEAYFDCRTAACNWLKQL